MSGIALSLWWLAAFAAFPLAGVAALASVGGATTPLRALAAGAVAGAVIGGLQWLVLRHALGVPTTWIAATAVAMGVGSWLSVAMFGIGFAGGDLLWRALIVGVAVGVAQALVLGGVHGGVAAAVWTIVVAAGWVAGWWIARAIGVDLTPHFAVFGSVGAIVLQVATGLVIWWLTARA